MRYEEVLVIYLQNQVPCREQTSDPFAWSWRQDSKFHTSMNNLGRCHLKQPKQNPNLNQNQNPTTPNQTQTKTNLKPKTNPNQSQKETLFCGLSGTGGLGLVFVQGICTAGFTSQLPSFFCLCLRQGSVALPSSWSSWPASFQGSACLCL